MVWFKIDDKFHTSSKVLSIPRSHRLAAIGLWSLAGTWAAQNLTDGRVPQYVLAELGATPRLRQALVEARLWLDHGPAGVEFRSWVEYQPTRDHVEAERAKAAERQRKARERRDVSRRDTTVTHGVTSGEVTDLSHDPDPTRPDPTKNSTSSDRAAAAANTPEPKRATRLPATWEPTPEHQERAAQLGVDLAREVFKFRTHAEDKGRTSKSWNAAFTQWLIRAAEYAPQRPVRRVANDDWMQQ